MMLIITLFITWLLAAESAPVTAATDNNTPRTHICEFSTHIDTREIRSTGQAVVAIQGMITTPLEKGAKVRVEVYLSDEQLYMRTRNCKAGQPFNHEAVIPYAHLWSPESTNLYRVVYTVFEGNQQVQQITDTFGIRMAEHRNDTLFLNKQPITLQAVQLPQSVSPLSYEDEDAMRYVLTSLRDMGCNAVVTETQIPSQALLRACDDIGIMLFLKPNQPISQETMQQLLHLHNHPSLVFLPNDPSPITNHQSPITNYQSQITNYKSQITNYASLFTQSFIPSDEYYIHRCAWNKRSHTLHIYPYWDGKEGEQKNIHIATDLAQVELFLNAKSLGKRMVPNNRVLTWENIPYTQGELRAVAYDDKGKMTKLAYARSAESPLYIELMPTTIGNLTFLRIRVLDHNNTLCTQCNQTVNIQVLGTGRLLGSPTQNVQHGERLVIIEGKAQVTVTSANLEPAELTITL